MKSKTAKIMREEMMAGGQLEQMKELLYSVHGGQTESVNAVNELLLLADRLSEQARLKGYHTFNVFDELTIANEKVCIEAAMAARDC